MSETQRTIEIPVEEYEELKRKAWLLDEVMKELPKIRRLLEEKLSRGDRDA